MLLDDFNEEELNTVTPSESSGEDFPLDRRFNMGDSVKRKDSDSGPVGNVIGYDGLVVKVRWNGAGSITAELVGNLEKISGVDFDGR